MQEKNAGSKKTRPVWNRVLWSISDSNRPPIDCEPIALPDELIPHAEMIIAHFSNFVQVGGAKIFKPRLQKKRKKR